MMVYRCDRCGKIIEPLPKNSADRQIKYIIDWGFSMYDDPTDGGEVEQIDVCASCYHSFQEWRVMFHRERLEKEEE